MAGRASNVLRNSTGLANFLNHRYNISVSPCDAREMT
jgi:hypothetical protein